MDDALPFIISGWAGAAIVVMGGAWATYRSIRSCRSVELRGSKIRAAAVIWWVLGLAVLTVTLALFDTLPRWVYWVTMMYMLAALMPSIRFFKTRLASQEESGARS